LAARPGLHRFHAGAAAAVSLAAITVAAMGRWCQTPLLLSETLAAGCVSACTVLAVCKVRCGNAVAGPPSIVVSTNSCSSDRGACSTVQGPPRRSSIGECISGSSSSSSSCSGTAVARSNSSASFDSSDWADSSAVHSPVGSDSLSSTEVSALHSLLATAELVQQLMNIGGSGQGSSSSGVRANAANAGRGQAAAAGSGGGGGAGGLAGNHGSGMGSGGGGGGGPPGGGGGGGPPGGGPPGAGGPGGGVAAGNYVPPGGHAGMFLFLGGE
jgi:hypothetical protein